MYKTVEQMQFVIDEYFASCERKPLLIDGEAVTDKQGNVAYEPAKPPTVTGLALALGFNSRQALLNYQGREPFNDTITRAKTYIEQYAEMRLYDRDGVQGAKFSLANNFRGWADKSDVNLNAEQKVSVVLEGELEEWSK